LVKLPILIDNQRGVSETTNNDHEDKEEGPDVFESFFDDQHVEGCLLKQTHPIVQHKPKYDGCNRSSLNKPKFLWSYFQIHRVLTNDHKVKNE
jgi:hypothetical protein